jgi:hypothetical protein
VFQKSPLAVPADQAHVDLESLKYFEVTTKFCDCVANYRKCLVLPRNLLTLNLANVRSRMFAFGGKAVAALINDRKRKPGITGKLT